MYICNSCRLDGMAEDKMMTVPAGEAGTGLAACGYEPASMRLPSLTAKDQVYSAGLCPCNALEEGSMFPELIREYGEITV